jgi:hypothetical protein
MNLPRLIVLLAALALVTACGSDKHSDEGPGGVDRVSVVKCLNDKQFVVQRNGKTISGSSPTGTVFVATLYRSDAAAQAAAANQKAAVTAVAANAVVDFSGNPKPSTSSPPPKLGPKDLAAIRDCIEQSR